MRKFFCEFCGFEYRLLFSLRFQLFSYDNFHWDFSELFIIYLVISLWIFYVDFLFEWFFEFFIIFPRSLSMFWDRSVSSHYLLKSLFKNIFIQDKFPLFYSNLFYKSNEYISNLKIHWIQVSRPLDCSEHHNNIAKEMYKYLHQKFIKCLYLMEKFEFICSSRVWELKIGKTFFLGRRRLSIDITLEL